MKYGKAHLNRPNHSRGSNAWKQNYVFS